MPRFRATVWFLSSVAESNADMVRSIYEREAESEIYFKTAIEDDLVTFRDVDNEVWFGPVSMKSSIEDTKEAKG